MPVAAGTIADAVRIGSEVFMALKKALHDAGHSTNVGDEGGFAPNLKSADEALAFITKACEAAGHRQSSDETAEQSGQGVHHLPNSGLKRAATSGLCFWAASQPTS